MFHEKGCNLTFSLVSQICHAKIYTDNGKKGLKDLSYTNENGGNQKWQLMLIPQASLGGKMKGKVAQYHGLIEKSRGEELYEELKCSLKEVSN